MTAGEDGTRASRVAAAALGVVLAAALGLYAVQAVFDLWPGATGRALIDGWLFEGAVVLAVLLTAARVVLVPGERLAWGLIAAGSAAWAAGDLYWWRVLSSMEEPPFPSVADGLYLALYPLAYSGLLLLLRRRVRRFHASQWLDGAATALLVAAGAAAFLLPPILAATEGSLPAVVTNLAYPIGDLLLLALIGALAALLGWRPGVPVGLLAAGFAIFGAADGYYLYAVATDSYVEGGLTDVLWPLGLATVALAAWWPGDAVRVGRLDGWRLLVLPGVISLAALALLTAEHFVESGPAPVLLAAAALVVCIARAGLTFRENVALADSHRLAITDSLTGLPNRRLFHDRTEQVVLRARRDRDRAAVMIIDLDRFKEVNDTLGHHSGDVLLREIGRRLRATVRESDTVARLGGDEFAVLLPDVGDAASAARVAEALCAAICRPTVIAGLSLETEASIGIALFPDHGDDVAELLQHADVAMYAAKTARSQHELYAPELDTYNPERLVLVGELRRAIDAGELVLHYQPKVDLTDGGFAGVEVLIRWQHPERGLLPPGEFIPFAEHTTLIRPLTLHVLDRALAQCRLWREEGREVPVAVNISARNLLDTGFSEAVADALARSGVPARLLELEITETVLMANPARALVVLESLDALGVTLSIDDFGTGYSSLNYLKRLPVNVLKIDRSFVMNMANSTADEMIVRSTIDLGRNLGLRVVAEGIEDADVYEALRRLGCHLGQGFHVSRPVPAEQIRPGAPFADTPAAPAAA